MQVTPTGFSDYRELISRTFVPLTAPPRGDGPFWAELDRAGCADMQITTIRSTAQRVRRTWR